MVIITNSPHIIIQLNHPMYITNFKLDDYIRKSKELNNSSKDSTNILNSMLIDDQSRTLVCKLFIESLKIKGPQILFTKFHLNWVLECTGYAFSLPLSELATIKSALKIYSDWLTVPESVPTPMKANFNHYQKEIFGHLSLIFYRRDDLVKQVELCNEVLLLYQKILRTCSIKKSNCEFLIHLMSLISDYLLIYSPSLADNLSNNFLKLLFEALLKSKTKNQESWAKAKKCIKGWNKNVSLVSHWASASCGLTKAVICMLYMQNYQEIEIVFDHNLKSPDPVVFSFMDDEKVYVWYKLTDFLFEYSYNKSLAPEIQICLAHSVHTVINNFLSLCEQRDKAQCIKLLTRQRFTENEKMIKIFNLIENTHKSYFNNQGQLPNPSIDSILRIYGKWIFANVSVDSGFDHLAKSELLALLCRIFSVAKGPANLEYLSNFFKTLLDNLKQNNKVIIGEILKSSTDLILYGIESLHFLLHPDSYIQHLNVYLRDKDTEPSIKSACFVILSIISPVCSKFQSVNYNKYIVDIFSDVLGMELDDENFSLLIWSVCMYTGTIKDDQNSLETIICLIFGRLNTLEYKGKDKEKSYEMIKCMSILPYLIKRNLIRTSILLQNVSSLITLFPKRSKNSEIKTTSALLLVITNWLNCFPEIFTDPEIRNEFFYKIFENTKSTDKDFILFINSIIINSLARKYTNETGSNLASFYPQGVNDRHRKHFIVADSLISAYQNNLESGFVIRNPSGMYSWKVKLVLFRSKKGLKFNMPVLKSAPQLTNKPEKCKTSTSDQLLADLQPGLKETFLRFAKKFEFQQNSQQVKNSKIASNSDAYNKNSECTFHRTFLAQIGLLENPECISLITHEQYSSLLSEYDSNYEKEFIVYPLLYLESPEDTELKIFTNKEFSENFSTFLSSLGSPLLEQKLNKHYSIIVDNYKRVIYNNFELFESLAIIPEAQAGCENFENFLENFRVLVLWNQRFNDFYSKKTPGILNGIDLNKYLVIVLCPIGDQVTRVAIFGNAHQIGPLMNQSVVPNEILGKMLNFTMYNYLTSLDSRFESWRHKYSAISKKKNNQTRPEEVICGLFK